MGMIRDRLVYGINDNQTQRRLLAEPDLPLQKAMEIAITMEAAETDVIELQQPPRTKSQVHKFQVSSGPERRGFSCFRCEGRHDVSD